MQTMQTTQTRTMRTMGRQAEKLPFWGCLTEDEARLVLDRQAVIRACAGQQLYNGSGENLGLIMVNRGVLRTYLLSACGKRMTLYRIKEGEICVIAPFHEFYGPSSPVHVEAEVDCELLQIPTDVYSFLMDSNIHVERDTHKAAIERITDVVTGLERLAFLSVEQRVASFLLDEAEINGGDAIYRTHEQIAANIGSAREVVSRSLKTMAKQDLVELFRGGVRLVDADAIRELIQQA